MPVKIGPKRRRRIFLVEWREYRGLTQETLAARLGASPMTVSRWERNVVLLNTDAMDAIAEALGIEPEDLYHHPEQPSPNQLMRQLPVDDAQHVLKQIYTLRKGNG